MNSGLKKTRHILFPLFVIVTVLSNSSAISYAQKSNEVYVYCIPESFHSKETLSYFGNHSDWEVVLCNLNESASLGKFLNLTRALIALGVQVVPPSVCTACLLKQFTWDEIFKTHASPLVGFFRDDKLTAITVGVTDHDALDEALMTNSEDVKVFTQLDIYILSNVTAQLGEYFPIEKGGKTEMNISNVILPITLLALADSVNPCTFALFTALLLITLHSLGEMRAAATGFSFIMAVFVGYSILGLGAFHILSAAPYVTKTMAVLGLTLGVFSVIRAVRGSFKSPVPRFLRDLVESRIRKSYVSIAASFVLGLIATFTLLPCSGGPYIVGLGLLSALEDPVQVNLLLVFYNLLFVMPLILITAAVLVSRRISHKIKVLRSRKLGIMELVSGALLAVVCAYLLTL